MPLFIHNMEKWQGAPGVSDGRNHTQFFQLPEV